MSDVIGRGVIEVSADSTKLKAGFDDAKRSIRGLGDASKEATGKASQSIDRYIGRLQVQQQTISMSARETELFKLSLRGASQAQLEAADSAIKLKEAYEKGEKIGNTIRTSFIALSAASVLAAGAMFVATNAVIEQIANYQQLSEKVGDTASSIASLHMASSLSGVSLDSVASASIKLTASLSKTDDESKAVGAAISALGLDFQKFKAMSPVEQLDAVAGAMAGFADGSEKTAVAVALFGKSGAEIIPFLNDLADGGERQIRLTDDQIKAADDYSKANARLTAGMQEFLQVQAAGVVPTLTIVQGIIADLARDETTAATATDILKAAMNGAIVVFQTIAIVGSDVGFVFLGVGREIGAIAAQLVALAHLDFTGFRAISDAVSQDAVRARAELDKFQARIMSIGQPATPADPSNYSNEGRNNPAPGKPKINISGLSQDKEGKGKNTAGQEAKAQLTADLDEIRKAQEATTGAYANAEKIMQAMRAAGLVDDQQYYASKLGFLNLNSQAQETALQAEIARLQKEDLIGKDKINNDRKIADAQAKLAKVRADAASNVAVNGIQEEAANKKIAQSYVDATTAAQAYLDTINRQNAREISGIGKGDEFRNNQAGISKIEDKQTTERQGLERDLRNEKITKDQFDSYLAVVNDTYAKEVEAYTARTAAIKEKQGDWLNGATEAFANYQSNAENVSGNTAAMFTNAFDSMTEGVASSISKSIIYSENLGDALKNVASSVADAFITSFIKIQIQKLFIDKTAATMYAGTVAAQSQAMVAMAGLAAFASTAAIPIVGPVLAPAAAATATAVAEGFAAAAIASATLSVASARDGFDIPAGVNPLTQLHEKEMVLPQQQANVIRDLAKNSSTDSEKVGSGAITIVNQTSAPIGKVTEQRLSNGERALIIEEALAATGVQLGDPNSKISRSMGRNFSVQRSR
ncbi:phage tail tape measure protein [Collimonas fungivorans]|uniref:Bacteriophage tail tape measure C-terminal domain-containing protein n=1 Tax=Collimonas fungivorans (strain Ter331) TaxID=1005048 RepID=G0AAH2_COLFT|nr:phage tail tape measure C-terminal domain-containing protein [Collimonas fungivorans]AEK63186.1 hypothetical protein CFU_3362 [Collimonas fungivorans Ter331]